MRRDGLMSSALPFLWFLALVATAGASAETSHGVASSLPGWRRAEARCLTLARKKLHPYPWPLRPFHRQHPVRGYFGDPRTVIFAPGEGLFSFHNGIDISAWPGNHVYPVLSGRVLSVVGNEVVIGSAEGRRFQYIHLRPWVRPNQLVVASRTVIGTVFRPWNHVHLSELRNGCAVNPLAPGHLVPYIDRTTPRVAAIVFRNAEGKRVPASQLTVGVEAIAQAEDQPAMPGPGVWRRLPVTPAVVSWRISTRHGKILLHGVAADFRLTEPPATDFCQIYAPGTVQNFAAEAGHFHWGRAGRYLFLLSPSPFATDGLHPGRYLLTVTARDTAGNTGQRTISVDLQHRRRQSNTSPAHVDTRCNRRTLTSQAAG